MSRRPTKAELNARLPTPYAANVLRRMRWSTLMSEVAAFEDPPQAPQLRPTIHFVAGLPRSGSTLLLNLLGQHPNHHVTPTSGVITLLTGIQQSWTKIEAFQAQGLGDLEYRIGAALRALMYGFYERELASGQIVFNKSRGWLGQIEMLEAMFRRPVPVIATIRDVKAIVASFEKLHRKFPLSRRHYLGATYIQAQTIQGRAEVLCSPGGVVGRPIALLRDSLNRGTRDRVVLVPYRLLTFHPRSTLDYIHTRLGLAQAPEAYDPDYVEQITQEDDVLYGWGGGLHTIRSRVEPPQHQPWDGVLPPHTCRWIDQNFSDINQIANIVPTGFPQGVEEVEAR